MYFKKYFIILMILVFVSIGLIFTLNYLVDPLWYSAGNRLFNQNYPYNERFSKANLFLQKKDNYNCILLGSSRVTLLDSSKISNYNCFNFSFSDGNPAEFVAYAKYIRKFGLRPNLTVIGIDARFYSRLSNKIIVPGFVKDLKTPPGIIKTYLSYSALKFSIYSLFRKSPQPRYYDENFIGRFLPSTKNYTIPSCFTLEGFGLAFTNSNFHYTDSIKAILQSDTYIGYLAPISAWDMLPLLEDGQLNSYLTTVYYLSKKFDRFYDFTIPSKLTKRTDNNYDGHHFSHASNNDISDILNGSELKFGLEVSKLSFHEYKKLFTETLISFSNSTGSRRSSSWGCPHRSALR